MTRFCRFWIVFGLLAVFAVTARAQSASQPWEKASIQLGGFITSSDTEMRVDSKGGGAGAVINLEDVLGVNSEKFTYRADGFYRFGDSRRHQVELHYFDSRRSGEKVLDRTVEVGGTTFPVGASVSTRFDLKFINLDYSYAFFQDDRVRLSLSGGLHTTGVHYKLDSPGLGLFEDERFTAPLPVVGIRGEVLVTERWRLKGGVDVFYLEYNQYTGSLADTNVAVEYVPFKHAAFGLALDNVRMKFDSDGESGEGPSLNGQMRFNFTGLLMYARFFY